MRRRELLLDLSGLALLALAVAAFFWPLLLEAQWIPRGGGDLVSFLWPMYRFAARSLRSGIIPLWNPHLYSGAPFVADNQSGVFYPINLLTFALFGEPSYPLMEALVVFHVWLAAANTFALARGLGLRRPAALLSGIAFGLSDLFLTHVGNLNLNATAAWLPLLLLFAHRSLTRGSAGWAAGAGAVLGVAALAGHGQMLLLLALTLVLYLLYRLAVDGCHGWRHEVRMLGLIVLIVAVGMGSAALVLLPTYQMAGHTGRRHLPYEEATGYSLPPRALVGLLAPGFYGRGAADFWGPWRRVEVGYAGIATLVLAVVGIGAWLRQRRDCASSPVPSAPLPPRVEGGGSEIGERTAGPESASCDRDFPTGFFALLVPLGFVLAMGHYTPLYSLLYRYAPTFDQVRAPARLIVLADLGLAALAAYGLDWLLRREKGRPALAHSPAPKGDDWAKASALIGGTILLVIGLPQARSVPPPDRIPQATTSIVIAAALLALSGLLVWLVRRWRGAAWLLPLLLAADLIGLGSTVEIEPNDPTVGFRRQDVVAFLQRDPTLFRIEDDAGAWQPSAALTHGLYDIGGVYNPLELAPYQAYRWAMGGRSSPLYNLLGVKYVLMDKASSPGDEHLAPVYTASPEIDVYVNTAALPRALMVYRSQVVADHAAAWDAVQAPGFEPTQTVVLEQGQPLRADPADGERYLSIDDYGLNEVELAVRTPVTGYLVLSDVYYPGWRATVDGTPTEVLRADYAFRAVLIPPGEHTVYVTFVPWTWRVGLGASLVTWIGLAVWAGLELRRRRFRHI